MELLFIIFISIAFLIYGVRHLKTVNQFSVFALDRNAFGSFAIYCTLLASGVGAGLLMGAAEKSYASGWFYTIACMGFTFQLILSGWLVPRIFKWRDCLSSGEILGKAFGGRDVRLIAGVLWLLFCMGIVSAQVVAMQRVSAMLLPADWHFAAAMLLSVTVILYSCLGGVRSVVITDIIQAVLLLSAMLAVVVWGVHLTGGWQPFYDHNIDNLHSLIDGNTSLLGMGLLFMVFFLGDALIPISIQRVTMSRSVSQARTAVYVTALIVSFVVLLSGALGTVAHLLDANQLPRDTFTILLERMPGWLSMVLLVGLLAAVMSSCDSYLNSAAVAFSNDVLAPLAAGISDQQLLKYGRLATLVIGVGAMIIACQADDILDLLVNSFEIWAPTLFPPMMFALFFHNNPRSFFYMPFVSGLLGVFLWKWYVHDEALAAGAMLCGMTASFLCYLALFMYRKRLCSQA
ncbi:hypothetical protein GZ77_13240 [Endozoicomonas montiporae]|uniref:Sodium:solute symporter n=2 Tax=Endozoicomonas montiporae TaxID=1027273 RepID=A0A081N4J6_9GAMM|nr:sodium:solute symporter family protein [Endozoicomonas montiporae]KEQ13369.1 hypothetical protein GZ77_13240 [Endozoicomonas montiporae]